MPMWTTQPPTDTGTVRHELVGNRILANVDVVPSMKTTVIHVYLAIDGDDEATVDRCKRRAEQLLIDGRRGEVR